MRRPSFPFLFFIFSSPQLTTVTAADISVHTTTVVIYEAEALPEPYAQYSDAKTKNAVDVEIYKSFDSPSLYRIVGHRLRRPGTPLKYRYKPRGKQ